MNGAGAADGRAGSVEGRQEAVAGGIDLAPTEPCELLAHDGVVLVEEGAPTGVTELGGAGGGADDVGEEDGGEPSIGVWRAPSPGEELLDLVDDLLRRSR